jgi:hypothetical protein
MLLLCVKVVTTRAGQKALSGQILPAGSTLPTPNTSQFSAYSDKVQVEVTFKTRLKKLTRFLRKYALIKIFINKNVIRKNVCIKKIQEQKLYCCGNLVKRVKLIERNDRLDF